MSRERMASGHDDEFSRALLRSADVDEPPAAAYAKVASALGVSVSAGLGASIAAPAAVAAVHTSLFAARMPATLLGKVIAFGVSGALLSSAVLWKVEHDRSEHHPAVATVAAVRQPGFSAQPVLTNPEHAQPAPTSPVARAAVALPVELSARHPAQRVAENQVLMQKPASELGVAPKRASGIGSASSLSEQVASLDRARVALTSGDASGALHEIALYRSNWPQGVFLTEASVLEIEALAKRGDRAAAAARAAAFVEAHPDSPQAERLRALIPN